MGSDCAGGRSGRLLGGIGRCAILNSQSWAGDLYSVQGASEKMRRVIDTIRNSSGLLCWIQEWRFRPNEDPFIQPRQWCDPQFYAASLDVSSSIAHPARPRSNPD